MRKGLVRLPNGDYINPAHVTSIDIDHTDKMHPPITRVWLNGVDSSYGFDGDRRDEFATLLDGTPRGSVNA